MMEDAHGPDGFTHPQWARPPFLADHPHALSDPRHLEYPPAAVYADPTGAQSSAEPLSSATPGDHPSLYGDQPVPQRVSPPALSQFTVWGHEPSAGPLVRRGSTGSPFVDASGDLSMPVYFDPFTIKHRRRTTPEQLLVLESEYEANRKPDPARRKVLADQIGMTAREVQVWYQNRRAKTKKLNKRAAERAVSTAGPSDGPPSEADVLPEQAPPEGGAFVDHQPYTYPMRSQPFFSAASVVPSTYGLPDHSFVTYDHPTPKLGSSSALPESGYAASTQTRQPAISGPDYAPLFTRPWDGDGSTNPSHLTLPEGRESVPTRVPDLVGAQSAAEGPWSRRPSSVSIASDVTELITPLTASFSFGDSSGPPSSTTSHDSFNQSDLDPKRRSSCPADFVNSMGTFALSGAAGGPAPVVPVGSLPYTSQDPLAEHPIAQWSHAVPPSATPDDSDRLRGYRWAEHLAIPRRHSVSSVPWPAQRSEQVATSNSPSPEIGRSPLPAHLYATYGRRPSSGSSSLLTIDEGSTPEPDLHSVSPHPRPDLVAVSAPPNIRRPAMDRKARSQSSLRTVQSHFGLEMTRTASDISTDRTGDRMAMETWSAAPPWQVSVSSSGQTSIMRPAPTPIGQRSA